MHWDRLFEDLEGQLAAEWEADRAALNAESERLRISRLELRSRLRRLCAAAATARIELPGGRRFPVRLHALGADWLSAESADADAPHARTTRIIPLQAIRGVTTDHGMLLASLDESDTDVSLRERMTLGFVLRDLARRRVPLHLMTIDGDEIHGTIDRAGADHLDLAVHDAGDARLARAVQSMMIIPFGALASLRSAGAQLP